MALTFLTNEDAVVRYDNQPLTEEQKARARENIGAANGKELESVFDIHANLNLLNPETATVGGMNASGGTYESTVLPNYLLTDFIAVETGDVIAWQAVLNGYTETAIRKFAFITAFDSNKNVLADKGSNDSNLTSYTVPAGVAYVRLTLNQYGMTVPGTAMVHFGTDVLPYEPYYASKKLKPDVHDEEYINSLISAEIEKGVMKKKPLALPPTLYGFVGYPISVYFRNIMDYHPNDVYIRKVGAYGKGNQFVDRWEYTPTTAETVTGAIQVYDHEYNQLVNQDIPVVVKDSTTKESLKVLVIGDSTVYVGHETQKMLDLASADGYDLSLLGTRGTAPNNHEGRSGWTTAYYTSKASTSTTENAFYNPTTKTFDFAYYMAQQGYSGVDCVFLQLGINDMFTAHTDEELANAIDTYLSNMETIMNSIHSYDANIKIIVNLIIPCDADQDAFTGHYYVSTTSWLCKKNTYEANIALLDRFGGVQNVYISHYNAAIDTENKMNGDVHPVVPGYHQLGTQMYSYMRAIN